MKSLLIFLAFLAGLYSHSIAVESLKTRVDVLDLMRRGEVDYHVNIKRGTPDVAENIWQLRADGGLSISGRGYGYMATKESFRDYHFGTPLTTSVTCEAEKDRNDKWCWVKGAPRHVFTDGSSHRGMRDPDWTNTKGFRGKDDLERPLGKWNRYEVSARGDTLQYFLNGVQVNEAFDVKPSEGRVRIQTEGAEMYVRRYELLPLVTASAALPLGPTITPAREMRAVNALSSKVFRAGAAAVDVTRPPVVKAVALPGPKPESTALSPEESLTKIHVPSGYRVEFVAAEPLVTDPVAFDWDERGRLWVVEMADYPLGMDKSGKPGGRVRMLEDTDGDGRYDKSTLFADGLNFPNGILTWRDGVIVTAAPEILFLRDTNGDGKFDERQVLVSGLREGNQQLRANGLRWGLDNWVYVAAGGTGAGNSNTNSGGGAPLKSGPIGQETLVGSRDFRFRPDTGELEPQNGPTQFGRNRDNWGHWFGTQHSNPLWHYVLPDQYLRRNPHLAVPRTLVQLLTPQNPRVYPASAQEKRFHSFDEAGHFTSACSGMIYRDRQLFPGEEIHAFVCEPFHNLVQHARVTESDVTFAASRVSDESRFDFFASEDRWCRPVMVREGPDGALWIADMYRYMIEHPQWLPPKGKEELLPNYRAGDERGRIYRVSRAGMAAFRPVRLDHLGPRELVAALDSSNGWQRDKVHQLLLWHPDKAALPWLEEMVERSANPLARLHALCVLDGLGKLPAPLVAHALGDHHPGVRENALRLAETRFTPEILATAVLLTDDTDAKVRLQLAFSLGDSSNAAAGEALGRLLIANVGEPLMVAAVLSSAIPHIRAIVAAVIRAGGGMPTAVAHSLLTIALGLNDRDALAQLLAPTLTDAGGDHAPNQFAELTFLLDSLTQRNSSLDTLRLASRDDTLARLLDQAIGILAQARRTALNVNLPAAERIAAAGLVGRDPLRRAEAVRVLTTWLEPQYPGELQIAAIRALDGTGAPEVPAAFASAWSALSPATRQVALNSWLSREPWAFDLMERFEHGKLPISVVDTTMRARLRTHTSARVRGSAAKVFAAAIPGGRSKVVEAYRASLVLEGEPAKGREVYLRLCAGCHRHGTDGKDFGPDLVSVVAHSPEKLLNSILDPSADIQPGFTAYTGTLNNGEQLYGFLTAETANSVTFKLVDGAQRTVLRNQISTLQSQDLSPMPEGLEAGINHQEMADLLSFLRRRLE